MKIVFARIVLWVICVGSFLGFNAFLYFTADPGDGWYTLLGFYGVFGLLGALFLAAYWATGVIRDHKRKHTDHH